MIGKDVCMFGGSIVATATGLSGALSAEPGQAVLIVTAVGGIILGLASAMLKMQENSIARLKIETDARNTADQIAADSRHADRAAENSAVQVAAHAAVAAEVAALRAQMFPAVIPAPVPTEPHP